MSDNFTLAHRGRLAAHPFAELIVEISQIGLSGSLRTSSNQRKAITYFRNGQIVYVVSNIKSLKLFSFLLRRKKLEPAEIARISEFTNDFALATRLIAEERLSQKEIDEILIEQMQEILVEVLTWADGEWEFDPKVRARGELEYSLSEATLLLDYARCSSLEHVNARFRSVEEVFAKSEITPDDSILLPNESFVLSMFETKPLKISDLRMRSAMTDQLLLQALYVLWLGGFLVRSGWNSAFPVAKLGAIQKTRLVRTKGAVPIALNLGISGTLESETAPPAKVDAPAMTEQTTLSLDEYLKRVEKAENHYEVLGLEIAADEKSIKESYFSLAKQFHPDKYRRESAELSRRIQSAFTTIAHAYESLKTKQAREAYAVKLKREQEAQEMLKRTEQGKAAPPKARQAEEALENFQQGLLLLNEGNEEAAIIHLARAVHFSPENALFQAHYGKALSTDARQKHKAEAALQTAVRLDPKNFKIRAMLVDFFIANNMLKRAEGELNRFLELVPASNEARSMLTRLRSRASNK